MLPILPHDYFSISCFILLAQSHHNCAPGIFHRPNPSPPWLLGPSVSLQVPWVVYVKCKSAPFSAYYFVIVPPCLFYLSKFFIELSWSKLWHHLSSHFTLNYCLKLNFWSICIHLYLKHARFLYCFIQIFKLEKKRQHIFSNFLPITPNNTYQTWLLCQNVSLKGGSSTLFLF